MDNDTQLQPEVSSSESNATTATENLEPQIQQATEVVEQPAKPTVQRMSHKDHMVWMRDISTQIRDHYEQKTGNKLSKPVSHALFKRDMETWFSARQREQAESADLSAIDPQPLEANEEATHDV